MKKLFSLSKSALFIGFLAGSIATTYELIKYILNALFLNEGWASFFYLIGLLVIIPITTWYYLKPLKYNFSQYFYIQLIGYFVCSILLNATLITIHHAVDTTYKERIADYKVIAIQESNQKIEQRINAKIISSDIDFEKMEKDEVANYELDKLLLSPFKILPIALIFSFIFSFILSIVQKFNLNKEN